MSAEQTTNVKVIADFVAELIAAMESRARRAEGEAEPWPRWMARMHGRLDADDVTP